MSCLGLVTERRFLTRENALAAGVPADYADRLFREASLVSEALLQHGVSTRRVAWDDPDVHWSDHGHCVIRTPWNYFERFTDFGKWLDHAETQTRICNSPGTLRWNWDKHYLQVLHSAGVRIVPTEFFDGNEPIELARRCGAEEWIIKPAISGAAWHTWRFGGHNADAVQQEVDRVRGGRTFLIQPLQRSVLTEGECSTIVIGGRATHSVRKVAKPGDFRVQDDHGGTCHAHDPSPEESRFAESVVASCPAAPTYARVDYVRDNEGQLALMELELIEPELFFRIHPPAADRFAECLAAWLHAA